VPEDDRGPGDLTKIIDQYEQQLKDADSKMITKLEEINNLKNRIADLEDSIQSKEYWEKPDYKFLVNENLDLRRKITELEQEVLETKADNKKLAQQISTMLERMRDADF
jgi:chromosome segregation ATPase